MGQKALIFLKCKILLCSLQFVLFCITAEIILTGLPNSLCLASMFSFLFQTRSKWENFVNAQPSASQPSHPQKSRLSVDKLTWMSSPLPTLGSSHSPWLVLWFLRRNLKRRLNFAELSSRQDKSTERWTFQLLPAVMQTSWAVCSVCILFQSVFSSGHGWQVLKNDATEIVPEFSENTEMPVEQPYSPTENETMSNRAKQGGERATQFALSRTGKKRKTVTSFQPQLIAAFLVGCFSCSIAKRHL